MRILYLVYGEQSGVVRYLTRALELRGAAVSILDARGDLRYRQKRLKLPSLRPSNLRNMISSFSQFGIDWKMNYFKTEFAFRHMTRNASLYIQQHIDSFDLILQSGVLFSAGPRSSKAPYCLYLDNTTMIHERSLRKRYEQQISTPSENWKHLERQTYEMADRIFTMSNFVKKSLIEDYLIPKEKILVVGAGPNFESLPNIEKKSYANRTVVFVGKDFYRKGGEVLLRAFQKVRKEIPDAKLVILGPQHVVEGPGIHYKGRVDFSEMPKIYAEGSIFVLPTLQEPFGLSFLEAMAYQLPCVGTDIQAIPEIIDNEETGFLIPLFDHEDLARRITLLLKDHALMRRMGKKGAVKIREQYTWDIVASKMLDEIRDVR